MNQSSARTSDVSLNMAVSELPENRIEAVGVSAVSDTELLTMLLQGAGTKPERAFVIASRLLAEAGSLCTLLSWLPADYRRVQGIGPTKALQLTAAGEIARRMSRNAGSYPVLSRAETVAAHMQPLLSGLLVEKFWVLCLNRKNRLMKLVEVTSGTATGSLVHPREVFRPAIREAACSIICVHNHPSGDPAPSTPDINVTRLLRDASRTVGVDLIDHVIVGSKESDPNGRGHYSFRESGLL